MIYARLTEQGTAAAETAVCEEHRELSPFGEADVSMAPPVDCSGNDALSCVVCDHTEED